MTVNVLGTQYRIIESDKVQDMNLENSDGYCDTTTKKIVIDTFQNLPGSKEDLVDYKRQVIRHELVHAFLFESGLDGCSWGMNEEIVDWIAIQSEKIFNAFMEANAL